MDPDLPFQYLWNPDGSLAEDVYHTAVADPNAATGTTVAASSAAAAPPQSEKQVMISSSIETPDLGDLYKKNRTAKETSLTMNITAATKHETGDANYATLSPSSTRIGSFENPGDLSVLKTFHGVRVSAHGSKSEAVSISFDPATLLCITCEKEHPIFRSGKLAVVCFSDQNFEPSLPADNGDCIAICRLENATLRELVDLTFEIFKEIPEGTVLCYGSASHLYRVGASLYTQEWAESNIRLNGKWRGISLAPLVPVIKTDCPGSLARDIEQLAAWIAKVYERDTRGLLDAWRCVLQFTNLHSTGVNFLESGEVYKNPMPATFSSTKLEPHCFVSNCSSPAQLIGLDRKTSVELLRALVRNLHKNFSVPQDPEKFLVRIQTPCTDTKEPIPPRTIIVIGSSIMGRVAGHLRSLDINVIDLSVPGWVATQENIAILQARLSELQNIGEFAVVLDLHSNSTFRYLQFDGTQSLPVKEGKRYHFPGEIKIVTDELFKKINDSVQSILLSAQEKIKIVIPPLPRHVFDRCCSNPLHCRNFGNDDYQISTLDGCTHLRNLLKKLLADMGVQNYWVLDGLGAVLGIDSGKDRGGNGEILSELRPYMGSDGVHFNESAYKNIAKVIIGTVSNLFSGSLGKQRPSSTTTPSASGSFYWRGYTSPCGSTRPRTQPKKHWSGKMGRGAHSGGGGRNYKPY
jgi:hypothetical protein